ncbi:hypothetical protein XENOCAPTIV_025030 [Xenoophorus captivus]|uniref:Uncharacterized protein n=1 Tax=Xenoophorus captivus TaxID=1517983 RepID=A0ABV0S5E3_9TELE
MPSTESHFHSGVFVQSEGSEEGHHAGTKPGRGLSAAAANTNTQHQVTKTRRKKKGWGPHMTKKEADWTSIDDRDNGAILRSHSGIIANVVLFHLLFSCGLRLIFLPLFNFS